MKMIESKFDRKDIDKNQSCISFYWSWNRHPEHLKKFFHKTKWQDHNGRFYALMKMQQKNLQMCFQWNTKRFHLLIFHIQISSAHLNQMGFCKSGKKVIYKLTKLLKQSNETVRKEIKTIN